MRWILVMKLKYSAAELETPRVRAYRYLGSGWHRTAELLLRRPQAGGQLVEVADLDGVGLEDVACSAAGSGRGPGGRS
jgi:hypothetical protein